MYHLDVIWETEEIPNLCVLLIYMILVFNQLRGLAQHSKNLTGGLYLLNMGLQVRYKFWKTVSALLRFGNMKSLEMSRLNDSLWVALLSHFQTAKPVWSLFTGCGRPSGCLQSIQRWKRITSIINITFDHILLDAGCGRVHSSPPWCPLSTRDGGLGSIWQEKDWRGRNAKKNHHRHGDWQEDLFQVVQGQVVLRRERPAIFCLVSSLFCCLLAVIGMQVGLGELGCGEQWLFTEQFDLLTCHNSSNTFRSQRNFDFQTSTAGLLHISVFLVLTLPAILVNRFSNLFCLFYISMKKVRASKVPVIAPWLDFGADFLGGLCDLCTYRWTLVTLAQIC